MWTRRPCVTWSTRKEHGRCIDVSHGNGRAERGDANLRRARDQEELGMARRSQGGEGRQAASRRRARHRLSAGALLAGTIGLTPLNELGVAKQFGMVPNALMAGLLVSFGGSFFDEALGAVRQFKKAQEQARKGGKA